MSEQVPTSRVKHFQHLPSDWKLVRLDQIVSQKITYGIVQPGAFDSSGIPLIRGVDYMSGWGNLESFYRVSKDLHQKFKRSTTRKGDVLLSIAGYAGHVSVVPEWIEEANIIQTSARISIEQSAASPPFVAYFLDSIEGKLQSRRYIKGSAQEGLNLDDVQKFLIPIPPLPEQKKIASILTSVDEVIEKTQSQIDKLQDLKKGTMNELLTKGIGHTEFKDSELGRIPKSWEVCKLEERLYRPLAYGVLKPDSYVEDGVPMLRIQDVSVSGLNKRKLHRISEKLHQEFKRTELREGDLVMSLVGTIGRVLEITKNLEGANVSRAFGVIGLKDDIDRNYVRQFLTSQKIQDWIQHQAQGNAQKVLNLGELRNLSIIYPPLPEQKKIASILTSVDEVIEKIQSQIDKLQSLKKSLMQDLLTGKVRVSVN